MINVCLFAGGGPVLLTVRSVFVCRRRACIAHCAISVCLFAGGGPVLLTV